MGNMDAPGVSDTLDVNANDVITPELVQKYKSKSHVRTVERKNTRFCLYPVSSDEDATIEAILSVDRNSDMVVAPNHHFDHDGNFCGFRVAYPSKTCEKGIPVNRKMFFGHTVVDATMGDCFIDPVETRKKEEQLKKKQAEDRKKGIPPKPEDVAVINHCENEIPCVMNKRILELVKDPEKNRRLMQEFLKEVDEASSGHEPTFECIPTSVEMFNVQTKKVTALASQTPIDSKQWEPELPEFIGIYHAFIRDGNKDKRDHKLYIVCSGGCPLAAELYYNTILDLNGCSTVDEVCDSEETWWLRTASQRARCRLAAKLAKKFNIAASAICDPQAFNQDTLTTRAVVDTVINDIQRMRSGHIALYNNCVDTTSARNGLVNPMHPVEGVWIFRGPQRASGGQTFGCSWGDQRTDGIFPSGSFQVPDNSPGHADISNRERKKVNSSNRTRYDPYAELPKIMAETSEVVVTYRCQDSRKTTTGSKKIQRTFSWYDEKALELLSKELKWDRNSGVVELMPIIVGITKW